MIHISYLEEKILTRTAFQLVMEKQQDCKVIYSGADIKDFCQQLNENKCKTDLCIIADCYPYLEVLKLIKYIKLVSSPTYILLKSDAKHIKEICFFIKAWTEWYFFYGWAFIGF